MKIITGFIVMLMFAGCQGGGDKVLPPESPSAPSPVAPVTPETKGIQWGDLFCQKKGDCENQFLNVGFEELEQALLEYYSESPIEDEGPDSTIFMCGQDFYQFCFSVYEWDTVTTEVDFEEMLNLANQVLEVDKCKLKPDLKNNLNNFLMNTEEYQDVN